MSYGPDMTTQDLSVLELIDTGLDRLSELLENFDKSDNVQYAVLDIARMVQLAAWIDADVAFASILHHKHEGRYAVRHCIDTALIVAIMAKSLGWLHNERTSVIAAALTMNLSMMSLQVEMQARGAPLSASERHSILTHPQLSHDILKASGVTDRTWLSCVLCHHENDDGSGYPSGKWKFATPEPARVLAVADRFSACLAKRSYRPTMLPNMAMREMFITERGKVDPWLVQQLFGEVGSFPAGTVVRLENNEVAVVTARGEGMERPVAHALLGPHGAPLSTPIKRDTNTDLYAIREVLSTQEIGVQVSLQQLWGERMCA